MSYQIVTAYAGQRLLDECGIPSLTDARTVVEDLWRDAPVEVVNEDTGRLHCVYDARGWHSAPDDAVRPVLWDE